MTASPALMSDRPVPLRDSGLIDRRRKAAILVQLLLADGQKLALARLPEDVQILSLIHI